jgi:hypothetical protein
MIIRIDCGAAPPAGEYCAHGTTRVVESSIGRYREAEAVPLARFVYRFAIEKIGRPHLAVIRYPDDRRRFMLIGDGTTYDLSTGVITGHATPVSGAMQELRQTFWPRWKECTLSFMTWGYGEPAAVESIEIHELPALPPLPPPEIADGREIGIQYEDCCGTGASEGARRFSDWLDRVVTYAKHTGQSSLSYPICWYHGPWFPSDREHSDAFSIVVEADRKQYIAWTNCPPDWPAEILTRFDREGLKFRGVLTLLRLSSVMKEMFSDLAQIQKGTPTINNMLWNGEVQAGTMDWTTIYNTENFPGLLSRPDPISLQQDFAWAFGERTDQTYREDAVYRPGPIFNPLHPKVQEAILGLVTEIGRRYGKFESFQGIAITMWAPTMIWFGSLHSGYDDFTIGLFEKETGIQVPGEPGEASRFSERYGFLVFQCREAWITWRCGKVRDLIRRMRDALTASRADLTLTLNLWSEPYVPAVLGSGKPEHQIHARPSTHALYREAGLDIRLLEEEPQVLVDLQLEGGGRDRTPGNLPDARMEHFHMHRDHDFLDCETLQAVAELSRSGAFIFNAWHEAWGKHRWFPVEEGDTNFPAGAETYGQMTGKALRINSEYPRDGFWWNSELRISAAFPPAPHFLEPYAHALAEFDAMRITRGGLFLDKAHGDEIRRFASAYRELPRVRFDTVAGATDPVAIRTAIHEGARYLYLVNRDYYPVDVSLRFSSPPGKLTDLATKRKVSAECDWSVTLGGFDLKVLRWDLPTEVTGFTWTTDPEIMAELEAQAEAALSSLAKAGSLPGARETRLAIAAARDARHLARLRRLLFSYPAQKAAQVSQL